MTKDWLTLACLIVGTFFMMVGSIGVFRMPDLYTRLHALSKCSTLGLAGLLLASVFHLDGLTVTVKATLAIIFHFLTNPVGAHMIARAAYYHLRVPFWEHTIANEWGRHDRS